MTIYRLLLTAYCLPILGFDMTQILSGICSQGIMVATDSMATRFEEDGKEHYFPVDKLFSVGSHAFIVSGGMGISVELSERFKQYAEERRLVGVEAMIGAAGAYLSDQYREALGKIDQAKIRQDQLDRIYFLVGGYSFKSQEQSYQLALWGSDAGKLPLEKIQIGDSVAVPRTLAGETRLFRMCQADSQQSTYGPVRVRQGVSSETGGDKSADWATFQVWHGDSGRI